MVAAPVPEISHFNPASGPVGSEVRIHGHNLRSKATRVKFNGVQAIINPVSNSLIKTVVPFGATTGPITVTTSGGISTSVTNYTVEARYDYSISVSPPLLKAIPGQTVAADLVVSSSGLRKFNGLVKLSAVGLRIRNYRRRRSWS